MTTLEQEFRLFDQVRLKTGGPSMTVTSLPGTDPVRCRFQSADGSEARFDFHPAAELQKTNEEHPARAQRRKRDKAFQDLKDQYPDLIPTSFHFECGEGWIGVLTRYFDEVRRILSKGGEYRLLGVTQRDGPVEIRTYPARGVSKQVQEALDIAEHLADSRSLRVCETCGRPGQSRGSGWRTVACDEHAGRDEPVPTEVAVFTVAGTRYIYDEPTDSLKVLSQSDMDAIPWLCD
jgi:uncharacterized protein YodC (DUF2158 family)